MRLSEKQGMMLYEIAGWTISFKNANPGGYSVETIRLLLQDILNQQSTGPVELEKEHRS